MNRSFSKIRHIQESNIVLEQRRLIKESEEGFGFLNSKNELGEELENTGSFTSFLKQQGFKDWSGGKPNSYNMNFHYISRKPSTPANLTCIIGQEKGSNTIDIDIVFDKVIERAERYKTIDEYDKKSAIPKIEKLVNKDFDMSDRGNFSLQVKDLSEDTAKKVILLYNQIKLVGPYSKQSGLPE